MSCPSENELLEYVDGLSPGRAAEVVKHLDTCETCRAVVASLARQPDAPAPAPAPAAAPEALPRDLLRQQIQADAPRRERLATGFLAVLIAAGAVFHVAVVGGAPASAVVLLPLLIHAVGSHLLLRRGKYWRGMPVLNTAVEISTFFAVHAVFTSSPAPSPVPSVYNPSTIVIGGFIVFSAIRMNPALSVGAGALAAALWARVYVSHAASTTAAEPRPDVGVLFIPMFLCLFMGGAAALLARYMMGRAEAALRAIREQDLFGKYVLHEQIGHGGMGEVMRATYCPEGGFTRTVAVKRVRSDLSLDERFVTAFRHEAQLSAGLTHPNLVQVLDFGRFRGALMLAMERVDGLPLNALLRRGPLPAAAVAYLGAELAAGLDYLHRRRGEDGRPLDLVHCDVNPPNVLLSRIGEVKLADFGVVRASGMADGARFRGKVPYAAPEQLRSAVNEPRADLFALGLTLHEAWTGIRVFRNGVDSRSAVAPPLSAVRPGTPPELEALVAWMTEREPERRASSAATVRARLLALAGEAAPYPEGERQLVEAVDRALAASSRALP